MEDKKISRRGVYYDLSLSPYEFVNSYGDIFKFSSAKKLEIYNRDIDKEIEKFDKFIERSGIKDFTPVEIIQLLERSIYQAFYKKVEG